MKELGHVKHCLFTIGNSWPKAFGKGSFSSLINVLFNSVYELCAKCRGNPLKLRGRQWILISNLKIESATRVSLGFLCNFAWESHKSISLNVQNDFLLT